MRLIARMLECSSILSMIESFNLGSNVFFLFHPRDYYKLSFCITFSNTFGNLWKLEERIPSGVCSINYSMIKYISLEVIFF